MLTIRALGNAESYAMYLEKESIGEWKGEGAEALGLRGEVTEHEYRSICRGEDPRTGEYLLPRQRFDQLRQRVITRAGERVEIESTHKARQAYGLVLSAPKTVSVQGLLFDSRLLDCHEEGVTSTVRDMEGFSGKLVIATYQHRTSRAGDPLIHSHLVVMNARPTEDGWRAVDAIWIYKAKASLTEHYEREVLAQAERLGYRTNYPHLEGISDELYNRFSQRSGERDDAIREYKEKHGLSADHQLSNRQVAALVYRNRQDKVILPPDVIRERQLARLTPHEHTQLIDLKERALERQQIHERVAPTPEAETPKERRKLSLRDGVHSEPDLKHEEWNYGETVTYRAGYKVRL